MGLAAGLNRYSYVSGRPVNTVDPLGLDSFTLGPITIPLPWTRWGRDPALNAAEDAHEAQHRADWLKKFPGWEKEQRGFARKIPILEQCLKELHDQKGPQHAIDDIKEALGTSRDMQDDSIAGQYWNDTRPRWKPWERVPTLPWQPGRVCTAK